jgi:hypothetical protein
MNKSGIVLLFVGACANFVLALIHVGIVLVGPPAYLYFGSAGLADLASQGSPLPAILTLILAGIFAGWGTYALAGAGLLPRPPWPRAALLFISFLYLARGSILALDILWLILGVGHPLRQLFFSLAALAIGGILLVGTIQRWQMIGVIPSKSKETK